MTLEELIAELGLDAEAGPKIDEYSNSQAAGLKRANVALKDEKRTLQGKLDDLSGLDLTGIAEALGRDADDLDIDDIPSLITQAKGSGEPVKDDARVAELERKLEKANKRVEQAEANASERIGKLNASLGKKDLASVAAAEITEQKGSVKALMPHVKSRTKTVVDEDGEITHVYLGPNGEPMEDSAGNPATLKMLIDEFRRDDELAGVFQAPPGGAGTKRPGGNVTTSKKWSEMNLDERTELKAQNPVLADRLKGEAA